MKNVMHNTPVIFAAIALTSACGTVEESPNNGLSKALSQREGKLKAEIGEACGDDIGVQCAAGLYCAFGEVTCATPPVVGECRPMGECGAVPDCDNPENIWIHAACLGESTCEDNTCGWSCEVNAGVDEPCGDDIDVQCADELYCAYGLNWCGTPPVVGVCRPMGECGAVSDCDNPENNWIHAACLGEARCEDSVCQWQCDDTAAWGETCGDDIGIRCGHGLYCAYGLIFCGTPPVTGVCRALGECGHDIDCTDADNDWIDAGCASEAEPICSGGLCRWGC